MIYIVADGVWFQDTLSGMAAFFNSRVGDLLIAMVTAISVTAGVATYIRTRNIMDLVKRAGFYVLMATILVGDRRSVQIINLPEPAATYQVDDVPIGLAAPASLITCTDAGMVQVYDFVLARPDALTYSKTEMLFGVQLAAGSSDFRFSEPETQCMFSDYVHNCVVGGVMLSNKCGIDGLMNSTNPYALVFSRPSPLRSLHDKNHSFLAYEQATIKINIDSSDVSGRNMFPFPQQVLNRMRGFTNQVSGPTSGVGTILFTEMLSDSYNYFHGNSIASTGVTRKNVAVSGLRNGLGNFSAQNGDTAGLMNTATQTSMAKMRLSQATSAPIVTNTLPMTHGVLLGIAVVLFPVSVVLAVVNSLLRTIIKGHIYTIVYLQMWLILFSTLNHAMNFYLQGKLNGTAATLATSDQVQNIYSDIGATAGRLALSTPFTTWGMMKGLGQVVSQTRNHLGQILQSASTRSSLQAIDDNQSCNNMTTGSVQDSKWGTNYSRHEDHMAGQLESGATKTLTSSGQSVCNTTEAISELPVDIMLDKTASSSWQQQQRDALSEMQSLSSSLSQTFSLATSQTSQWNQQRENSGATMTGNDASANSNLTKTLNTIQSTGSRYARDEDATLAEGIRAAATKSQDVSFGAGASVSGRLNSGRQFAGKIAEFTTDVSIGVEAHLKEGHTGRSGSSHGTSPDLTRQNGTNGEFSAQELKDFRDTMDVATSSHVTGSGNHTDNTLALLANQLSPTFSSLKSQASQHNDVVTRSHECSQLVSYAENNSASINQNYLQGFVGYITNKRLGEADQLLSNTASPEVRAGHDGLAQVFVENHMEL